MLVLTGLVAATLVGCSRGDDSSLSQVVSQRAAQARAAARSAGLGDDAADVVARAARAPAATFSAVYEVRGTEGRVVVHQRPPRQRVDAVDGDGRTVSSFVSDGPNGSWSCQRGRGSAWRCVETAASDGVGAFDPSVVDRTVTALAAADAPVRVERMRIAGVDAACVRSGPSDRFCVSPSGVPLVVERSDGGQSLRVVTYRTTVDTSDLDRPDR